MLKRLYALFPRKRQCNIKIIWRNNTQEFSKPDKRHQATDSRSTTNPRKNTKKTTSKYIIIKLETKFSFCWMPKTNWNIKKWSKNISLPERNNHKPHSWLLNRNTESPAEKGMKAKLWRPATFSGEKRKGSKTWWDRACLNICQVPGQADPTEAHPFWTPSPGTAYLRVSPHCTIPMEGIDVQRNQAACGQSRKLMSRQSWDSQAHLLTGSESPKWCP